MSDLTSSPNVAHLTGVVAHTLRNPLAALSATAQLMRKNSNPSTDFLDQIDRQVDNLVEILDTLAAFAPLPQRTRETHDFMSIAHIGFVENLELLNSRDIAWQCVSCVDEVPIAVPQGEVEQAIKYLCRYLAHTAEEGSRLRCEVMPYEESHELIGVRKFLTARLSHESGAPSLVKAESFHDHRVPGAAIGIAVSQAIFRHYGYQLRLYREDDGTASFMLMIPANEEGMPLEGGDPVVRKEA